MVTVVYNDKSTILCIVAIGYIELIQKIGTVKKTNHLQSPQQHKFLYCPLTKEIYIQQTSTYEEWFASKITRQRIFIISDTLDHNFTILLDSFPIESTKNKSTFNIQIIHKIPTFTSSIPAN